MAFVIIFIPSSRLVEFAIIRRDFLISNCAKKKKKDFSVSCVLCRDVEDLFIFLMVVVLVCLLLICIILSDYSECKHPHGHQTRGGWFY